MKFSIKDSFSKSDQIRRKLRIWSHSLKKPLMENFNPAAYQKAPHNKVLQETSTSPFIQLITNNLILINTLSANYEYSRSNRENLPLPIQIKLSKKP